MKLNPFQMEDSNFVVNFFSFFAYLKKNFKTCVRNFKCQNVHIIQ